MNESRNVEVKFIFRELPYDNRICTCCHGMGRVHSLEIPHTQYEPHGKEVKLETFTEEIWLCDDCRKKLTSVLTQKCKVQKKTIKVRDIQGHAEWIPIDSHLAKCSHCGNIKKANGVDRTGKALIHRAVYRFCENCGYEMEP